ncbi:MAG: HAD family hydrolase [Caldilineaceae bacterium]
MSNQSTPDDDIEIRPGMEPLTPDELERFLARARARGHTLTPEEQYAIFGPPPKPKTPAPAPVEAQEAEAAYLDSGQIARLQGNFFPELGDAAALPAPRLVQGIIFDFDDTLAHLTRPLDELMAEGAKAAEQYMRSTGMDLPADFWQSMIEARRFAQEKSEEEQEEHIADDALSFLLQFFSYPASKMDPEVLKRAVDIFYAPEMTAWQLNPGALELLKHLNAEHYKVAIVANYNCDRVFQRTIDYLGLRPYLDVCLTSASVEYRKPDEKIFTPILERWGVLPYEVVVVGDSLLHDIKGGIELGALTVQCMIGVNAQVALDNQQVAGQVASDAVVDNLVELPAIVQAWAGG